MISCGTRLRIAIGITVVSLTLNAVVILNGLGEKASVRLLTFYGGRDTPNEMQQPPTARYAADSRRLFEIRMKL